MRGKSLGLRAHFSPQIGSYLLLHIQPRPCLANSSQTVLSPRWLILLVDKHELLAEGAGPVFPCVISIAPPTTVTGDGYCGAHAVDKASSLPEGWTRTLSPEVIALA